MEISPHIPLGWKNRSVPWLKETGRAISQALVDGTQFHGVVKIFAATVADDPGAELRLV